MLGERPPSRLSPTTVAGGLAVLVAVLGVVVALQTEDAPPPRADEDAGAVAAHAPARPDAGVAEAVDAALPPGIYEGVLEKNQTVTAMLQRHGVTPAQVHRIVASLREVYDFRLARPGARYRLELDPATQKVQRFRFMHGPLEVYEARREGDRLAGTRIEVPVRVVEAEVAAVIESSLYGAMQRVGEGAGLVARVTDVFAWDLDFYKDTRSGDRFRVVVEKIYKDDEFIRYGRILAAEYAGEAGTFRTFWFVPEGVEPELGGYYLEDGQSARKTFLATPLKFVRISSGFGRRKHPILGYTKAHMGVDYAAPTGTPIWAMADGKVRFAGRKGPNGNLVVIQHENGLRSYYAHLHRIGRGIKKGVEVRQKQVIGTVGATGRATGPHLHFAVKKSGKYLNPQKLKMTRGKPVAEKHRADFEAMVKRRVERLQAIGQRPAPTIEPPPDADDLVATDEP